jgi:hypothetical protein
MPRSLVSGRLGEEAKMTIRSSEVISPWSQPGYKRSLSCSYAYCPETATARLAVVEGRHLTDVRLKLQQHQRLALWVKLFVAIQFC